MTDAEKLHARLRSLQLLAENFEAIQNAMERTGMAAEHYRICAAITARQTETLLELAKIMQENTEIVEIKGEES